jgi:hypothetical protein
MITSLKCYFLRQSLELVERLAVQAVPKVAVEIGHALRKIDWPVRQRLGTRDGALLVQEIDAVPGEQGLAEARDGTKDATAR